MKRLVTCLLLALCSTLAVAQHSSLSYKKLADSLYRHHNYSTAITYYERSLKKSKQPGDIMLQVANCYKHMNNIHEAEAWYAKAKENNATFSPNDTYEYVQVFMMQEKRQEAEALLEALLNEDPGALQARKTLDDIRNVGKFFKDSAELSVTSLSINTPQSEFAPEYYKDGIVFSSAQEEKFSKKKYHWDDSHFLNLYYSKKTGEQHESPQLFDQNLDSKFHDGPVSFYANQERMIVNRNRPLKITNKQDTWIWHLSLFDGRLSADKTKWELTALPFDEPPYSSAHPWVAEDGNTIYFSSDRPGGYGGMDIYRVVKKNGIWTKPFNLGPMINTPENEVFPFLINSTLYFSSDGHGGMGGLDNFKSVQTANGFAPPVNLGFPINSHFDDFSLVTAHDEQSGYFSSARSGNDDLYEFRHLTTIKMLAQVVDGKTNQPLAGASVQLMTYTSNDVVLTADEKGNVAFELPRETSFTMVGSKDGKSGTLTGTARPKESREFKSHKIAVYGDTSRIACVGFVKNEMGASDRAARVRILDETTGKEIANDAKDLSMVNFEGERGHNYTIEIENSKGEVTTHQVSIAENDTGSKSWEMVLKEATIILEMAAQTMRASDRAILKGAKIKLATYSQPDVELISNEEGIVEFSLKEGTAYVLTGTSEDLKGVYASVAEAGLDKEAVVHPVLLSSMQEDEVPVATMITDEKGEILTDATATVTNRVTGEQISSTVSKGMLSFMGQKGKDYNIAVENKGQPTILQEVVISGDASELEKISVVIDEPSFNEPASALPGEFVMAARVVTEKNNTPVADAQVKVITYIESDIELTSDAEGLVDFTLAEGTAYMVVATKGELTGMHAGVAVSGMEKSSFIHDVPVHSLSANETPVMVQLTDEEGNELEETTVTVREKSSGLEVESSVNKGMVTFVGEKGKDYAIAIDQPGQGTVLQEVTIADDAPGVMKTALKIDSKKLVGDKLPVVATLKDRQGNPINNAAVKVIDTETGEQEEIKFEDGVLTFEGEKGKGYTIEFEQQGQPAIQEEIVLPQTATTMKEISIIAGKGITTPDTPVEVTAVVKDEDGNILEDVQVTVTNDKTGEQIPANIGDGIIRFLGERGSEYSIAVTLQEDNSTANETVTIPSTVSEVDEVSIVFKRESVLADLPVELAITDEKGTLLKEAKVTVTDKATGKQMAVEFTEGIVHFNGEKGKEYVIDVDHTDYHPANETLSIPKQATSVSKVSIPLTARAKSSDNEMLMMAARVFKAENDEALAEAKVTIITLVEPDVELVADSAGRVEFSLPNDIAYIVVATKDGYNGMHSGIASPDEAKTSVTHPVPAYNNPANLTPVVGLIASTSGEPVTDANVIITDNKTSKQIPITVNNGVVSFMAENGSDYSAEVTANHYEKWEDVITVDTTHPEGQRLNIALVPETMTLPSLTSMIILNESGITKVYVSTDGEALHEVIEEENKLFIKNGEERIPLGDGSLSALKNDTRLLTLLSLSEEEITIIPNIYFDYNSPKLDETDEAVLDKVKVVLERYTSVQLTIHAHADDRGSDRYNLNLSRRRARAVQSYLTKTGLRKNRVSTEAYGETLPAIKCPELGCSEDDHQKNRRAEFALRPAPTPLILETEPVVTASIKKSAGAVKPVVENRTRYEIALDKYGSSAAEGLSFKVTIGAYRYNHDLKFPGLDDLGTVESKHQNGITYYYLGEWPTLREVENMRQTVIKRGVTDAGISIYHNGDKINFQEFITLVSQGTTSGD